MQDEVTEAATIAKTVGHRAKLHFEANVLAVRIELAIDRARERNACPG